MGTMDQGTPPEDGSVTEVSLADGAVTDAKIATQVSTKITGLPTQTQDLDMGKQDIDNVETLRTLPTTPTLDDALVDAVNMDNPRSVYVVGKFAYVVSETSNSLAILNISDEDNILLVGKLIDNTNLNGARSVYVSNGHAYIASKNFNGIAIVDVTFSTTPVLVGQLASATKMGGASGVYVSSGIAYVTGESTDSLAKIDISDPTSPKLLGSLIDSTNMNGASSVRVKGDFAYVTGNLSDSLAIYDITGFNPLLKGKILNSTVMNGASHVYISGNLAYVTGFDSNSLAIINIADHTNPTLTGSLIDNTNMIGASAVYTSGDFAYVTGQTSNSIAVIQVDVPATPVLASKLISGTKLNGASGIFITGNHLVVTGADGDSVVMVDIAGISSHVANIGNLTVDHLSVTDNAVISNNMYAESLNVGALGLHVHGNVSMTGDLEVKKEITVGDKVITPDVLGTTDGGLNLTSPGNGITLEAVGGIALNSPSGVISMDAESTHTITLDTDSGNIEIKSASGDIEFNTNDLFIDTSTSRTGFGTITPLGNVHIKTSGTASSTTSFAKELTLESALDVGQTIIAGDNSNAHIVMRNQSDTTSSIIRYRANGETFTIDVGSKAGMLSMMGSGAASFADGAFNVDTSKKTGFGTNTPLAKVNILTTTEQLRLSYDVTNYSSFITSSSGGLLIAPSGGSLSITGDATISGNITRQKWKEPVILATIVSGDLGVDYNTGQTVDGIILEKDDRILLKNQTTASQNGIYTVADTGNNPRASDFDGNGEVFGSEVRVTRGTYAGVSFKLTNTSSPTIGTDSLTFEDSNNTTKLKNIYVTEDWGVLATAPDGVQRVPLIASTTYNIHTTHTAPLFLMPVITSGTQTITFNFVSAPLVLNFDGSSTPSFWGRDVGGLRFIGGDLKDIGNGGLGLVGTLFDLVGFSAASFMTFSFSGVTGFKRVGSIVEIIPVILNADLFTNNRGGLIVRGNSGGTLAVVDTALFSISTTTSQQKSALIFQGSIFSILINGCQGILQSGKNLFEFDSALSSSIAINGCPHQAGIGNFFAPTKAEPFDGQVDGSKSFTSIAAGSAGFSVLTFTAIQDFTVGQIILVKGDTGTTYDGLQTITSVSADQKSFTINVTFVATDTGKFQITIHSVVSHEFSRGGTVTIAGTGYTGTFKILAETDTTISIPQEFTTNDENGTFTSNPLDQTSTLINADNNGIQADSESIAFGNENANTTATTITDGTYAAMTVGTLVSDSITERFELTNATLGIWKYIGKAPFKGFLTGGLWAVKSGSTANYRFAMSIDGAIPVFASANFSPMEVKTTKISIPLEFVVNLTENQTIQIMSAGDGTSDTLTITDIRMGIQ